MVGAQIFPIKPPPRSTMFFAWGVIAFLLALMLVFIKVTALPWLILSTFLPIFVVFAIVAFATRSTRFEVSRKGLEISGDWCGDTLSWDDLDLEGARLVRFSAEPGLRPKWKLAGLAMPGYSSGSFRLHNKARALIFLTDPNEALYLPTRKDFCVLLSSVDNVALLCALKNVGKV